MIVGGNLELWKRMNNTESGNYVDKSEIFFLI